MADIKEAFAGSLTSLTLTSANLASSATAGWQSQTIDNSTNLYDDYLVMVDLAAVNTSAGSTLAAIFLFLFPSVDGGTTFQSTGDGVPSGSVGTLTYPDVTSKAIVAPLLGVIPYPVQNKQLTACFSLRAALNGVVPQKFSIGMLNYAGQTLSVNSIKLQGVYNTVL